MSDCAGGGGRGVRRVRARHPSAHARRGIDCHAPPRQLQSLRRAHARAPSTPRSSAAGRRPCTRQTRWRAASRSARAWPRRRRPSPAAPGRSAAAMAPQAAAAPAPAWSSETRALCVRGGASTVACVLHWRSARPLARRRAAAQVRPGAPPPPPWCGLNSLVPRPRRPGPALAPSARGPARATGDAGGAGRAGGRLVGQAQSVCLWAVY